MGIFSEIYVTFGCRVVKTMVGVISGGDFDLLMGNDLNSDIGINIDI